MTARSDKSSVGVSPWNSPSVISNHKRRQRIDIILKVVVTACVIAVVVPLGDLLFMFCYRGIEVISLKVDPRWESVRSDSRFIALVEKLGLPQTP